MHLNVESESSLLLKPKESKLLIAVSDIAINKGHDNTGELYCDQVADYIRAYNTERLQSKVECCREAILYSLVDVGQGEYTITYQEGDFN